MEPLPWLSFTVAVLLSAASACIPTVPPDDGFVITTTKTPSSASSTLSATSTTTAVPTTTTTAYCEEGWALFSTFCYKIFPDGENFDVSQAVCVSEGAQLASVHSAEEQAFIEALAACGSNYLRIGVVSTVSGVWINTDGTPFDYSYFDGDEVDDTGFVEMYYAGCGEGYGLWNSYSGNDSEDYLCKKNAV